MCKNIVTLKHTVFFVALATTVVSIVYKYYIFAYISKIKVNFT